MTTAFVNAVNFGPYEVLPVELTDKVREMCLKVSDGGEPQFVPVRPAADAVVRECYLNVGRCVQADPQGKMVYGWQVWIEKEGRYLNFVHHAVFQNGHGELLDPTPAEDGEAQILFVPDARRVYEGHLIAPHIVPLIEDRVVWEFADAAMSFYDWHEKHTRAKQDTPKTDEYRRLERRYNETRVALNLASRARPVVTNDGPLAPPKPVFRC